MSRNRLYPQPQAMKLYMCWLPWVRLQPSVLMATYLALAMWRMTASKTSL